MVGCGERKGGGEEGKRERDGVVQRETRTLPPLPCRPSSYLPSRVSLFYLLPSPSLVFFPFSLVLLAR